MTTFSPAAHAAPLLDGRFLLLENLGQGGMGRVVRAFDRVHERMVALKTALRAEPAGPGHPLTENRGPLQSRQRFKDKNRPASLYLPG